MEKSRNKDEDRGLKLKTDQVVLLELRLHFGCRGKRKRVDNDVKIFFFWDCRPRWRCR